MGRVHRHDTATKAKQAHKRRKQPCRSAPKSPTGVGLTFHQREKRDQRVWVGRANWNEVTKDVADRDINVEEYHVQLRAVDASGEPVETKGQEQTQHKIGSNFTVLAGTAPVNKQARELNASPDRIQHDLFGLTTGIGVEVDFYLRKEQTADNPTVQCEIWNVTAGSSVASKNATPDNTNVPRLGATLKFTPAAGVTYAARVTWQSGTGKAMFHQVEWHDFGEEAIWNKRQPADEANHVGFLQLPRPRVWYYQCRVRAMNRVRGTRCWSAWSGWTVATNPVTGNEIGPPVITGLTLEFDQVEGRRRGQRYEAVVSWDEVPQWMPPDGEPVEGADKYAVRLQVSEDGSTPVRTRRKVIQARDEDADTTKDTVFGNIRKRRFYRASVRPIDSNGNRGAWSAWTSWVRPSQAVGAPQNVATTKPRAGHLLTKWDEPTNADDVEEYIVRVYQGTPATNLKETVRTRSRHHRYVVPQADRGTQHKVKVAAVDEDGNESTEFDTPDQTDDAPGDVEGWEVGDTRFINKAVAAWLTNHPKWLRANGDALFTASYPDLFAEIGYTHGGSGPVFNLPDYRGRHPMGASSVYAVGSTDADLETARSADHLHSTDTTAGDGAEDATDAFPGADFTSAFPATDQSPESGHRHGHSALSGTQSASSGSASGGSGTPVDLTRQGHVHAIQGFLSDFNFENHSHGHGHGGHQHGHGHGGHGHRHRHGNHGHNHQHNNRSRPRINSHVVIKALP